MPANICPACETPWPHIETYKTVFGSKAQRSANEHCPVCDVPTAYSFSATPLTPEAQDALFTEVRAQAQLEAFERWYADREAAKLTGAIDAWLAHESV